MYVVLVDAVLGFSLLYKLKPRAYNLRILLLNPLDVLCAIERYLKPFLTRHKPIYLVLTY